MLEADDLDRLKEIFVTRRECSETTEALEKKLSNDNVRLAIIETELRQIKWLLGTVLAATLANLANSFINMMGG